MTVHNITVGAFGNIQRLRVGRPDGAEYVIFDRDYDDKGVLASNIDEAQAGALISALVEAFPAIVQFSDFQIESRVVGLKWTVGPAPVVEPEPVPAPESPYPVYEPKTVGYDDHPVYEDCTDSCVAARASVRLFGEAGHPVGPTQMQKQRDEEALVAALSPSSYDPFEDDYDGEELPW